MAIRLGYFLRIPNVGDRINPLLVEAISGQQAVWTGDHRVPHLLAAGSVLSLATPASTVWGSGVMHPDLGVGTAHAKGVRAVRGPLTWKALREAGGLALGDVPFGDTAYLAPRFLGVSRRTAVECLGVVSHYTDREHPQMSRLLASDGVVDLNVHADPLQFLRAMAECSAVASSSLHGLIFAEALGIPNLWIKAGDAIAGGDFKFRDWFGTTGAPQVAPYELDSSHTPGYLSAAAELHDSKIDGNALAESFPRDCPSFPSAIRWHEPATPVFLISFNRAEMLRRSIAGVRNFSRTVQVVVHDNGSTDSETLALLNELETTGVRIFRHGAISNADELNNVNETVQEFFADWAEPVRYVVSDCDIDLSVAAHNTLDAYDYLLNRYRHIESVGPMLRIRDIPRDYPLFNRAMNRHVEQFWRHQPSMIETPMGQMAIQECLIDTTFALHRAGEPFRRLKRSLRVYEPYEALHLDWYRTEKEDDGYTASSNPLISHWNNYAERMQHRDVALEWRAFTAVRRCEDGSLESYRIELD